MKAHINPGNTSLNPNKTDRHAPPTDYTHPNSAPLPKEPLGALHHRLQDALPALELVIGVVKRALSVLHHLALAMEL